MININEIFENVKHIEYGFYHQQITEKPKLLTYLDNLFKGKDSCDNLPNYMDNFCDSFIYDKNQLQILINKNLDLFADETTKCNNRLTALSYLFNIYNSLSELMPEIKFITQIVNWAFANDEDDLINLNKQIINKPQLTFNDLLIIIHNPSLADLNSKFIDNSVYNNQTELGKALQKWLKTKDEYDRFKVIVLLQSQLLSQFSINMETYIENITKLYSYIDSEEILFSDNYILPSQFYQKVITNLPISKCYNLTNKQFVELLQIVVIYTNNAYIDFNIEELNNLLQSNQLQVSYIQSIMSQWVFVENSHLQFQDIVENSLDLVIEFGLTDNNIDPDYLPPLNSSEETISQLISNTENEIKAINNLVTIMVNENDITDEQKEDILKRKDKIQQYLHKLNLRTKKLYDKIQSIQDSVVKFQQSLIRPFAVLNGKIVGGLHNYLSKMQDTVGRVNNFFTNISGIAQGYIDEVKGMIENIGNSVLAILDIINSNNFVANLLTMLTTPFEALFATLNQIVCALKAILCFLASVIKGIIKVSSDLSSLIDIQGIDTWSEFTNKLKEAFGNNTCDIYDNLMRGYNSNLTAQLAGSVHQKLGVDKAKEFKEEADKVFNQCLDDNKSDSCSTIKDEIDNAFTTLKSHTETAIENILALKEALNCKPYNFGKFKLNLSLNFNVPHFELPKLDSSKFACIGDNDGI